MLLRFNASTLSLNTPRRILYRSFLMLLTLSLLAGTVISQTDQKAKRASAKRLFNEGAQLSQERTKESFEAAIRKFAEALAIYHSLHDRSDEAATLSMLGLIHSILGEHQKALVYYEQALPIYRAVQDRKGEAQALTYLGGVYIDLGEMQKALNYYEQALSLHRLIGNRDNEAQTLNDIGVGYFGIGEQQKALDYFGRALSIFRAIRNRSDEAQTLTYIGGVYNALGERKKALDYFGQALPIYRAVRDRDAESKTLNDIGAGYSNIGDKQKALDYFLQALPLRRAVGDRNGAAVTLTNLGGVYNNLGEQQKALDYYEQALSLNRLIGNRDAEAQTLSGLGEVYRDLGKYQKALDYYEQVLPIFRAVGDRSGEARTLNNIGLIYSALGEKRKALDYFRQALPLRRAVGDRNGEARTLTNLGAVYFGLGERQKALDYYKQALPIFHTVGDQSSQATMLFSIAVLESDRGNLSEALTRIEAALSIIESLRIKIINQELRSSYFATVQNYYQFYIDLLMRLHGLHPTAGHDGQALQVSERARARALLETLAEANADIRQGVDPKLVERERALQKRLNASAQEQMSLLSDSHTQEQANAIAKKIEALTIELQQVETQIRQTSPRYAALTQPKPLDLKAIQEELDADTLLLEYSLSPKRSYVWAVTPDSITGYELPKRDEIEAAARRLYDLLNARNKRVKSETQSSRQARVAQSDREIPTAVAALSRMLLAPVVTQLGKKRLIIVADGMLQYIPFAALTTPSVGASSAAPQPLIVEHEIVSLPSASTLSVIRRELAGRKSAPKTVVALADPVFMKNDERVKGSRTMTTGNAKDAPPRAGAESMKELELVEAAEDTGVSSGGLYVPRLPGSRQEAKEIVAMVPAAERKLALDFEASREVATSAELSQYRYVHFSTHGFLNSVHPELSGIVFSLVNERGDSQDGFLRAHEVFNLKLPAEVVVLSACQTGIGKEVKGEGLVSLTRGFMYAGSPRVVVSLWSVGEIGTAELMVRFYREMLKGGKRPAEALRAAQVSLMKEKKWQSPFYWAAFTLQGEWR